MQVRLKIIVLAVLLCAPLLLGADKSKDPGPGSEQKELDRGDAKETAVAVLTAYKVRDLKALAELSTEDNKRLFQEIAEQGESHPRYKSIFSGWRWNAVSSWSGGIKEVRYFFYHGEAIGNVVEARAYFADLGPDEVAVVTMTRQGKKWMFEDLHSPDRAEYEKGALTAEEK